MYPSLCTSMGMQEERFPTEERGWSVSLWAKGGFLLPSSQALACASVSSYVCWNLLLFLFTTQLIIHIQGRGKQPELHIQQPCSWWWEVHMPQCVVVEPCSVCSYTKVSMTFTWKACFSEIVLCLSLLKNRRHIMSEWLIMLPALPVEKDKEVRLSSGRKSSVIH